MKSSTNEELSLMSYYNPENGRLSMITVLTEALPAMEDELAAETVRNALKKLNTITDAQFDALNFTNMF